MGVDVTLTRVDLEAFDSEILRLADAWLSKGEPALINALGVKLGPTLGHVKAETGKTFSEYLRDRFSDRFNIVPVKPNTPGLWPKDKPYSGLSTSLPPRSRLRGSRRYFRWLWNAFAEPLSTGKRFYDPKDRQIHDAEVSQPGWLEIPTQLVRPLDEPINIRQVHEHIERWLDSVGLRVDEFIESEPEVAVPVVGRSVLEAVIQSLSARQLQSISLPLDVVAELAKQRA